MLRVVGPNILSMFECHSDEVPSSKIVFPEPPPIPCDIDLPKHVPSKSTGPPFLEILDPPLRRV